MATPRAGAAVQYNIKDLGTLGGGIEVAFKLNNSGHAVGYSNLPAGSPTHGFKYDGTIHDLGTLGGEASFAFGINSGGQVVGMSRDSQSRPHAFMYDTSMHDLGTLGGTTSYAYGVNDSGRVVGDSLLAGELDATHTRAFMYDGTMHDLGFYGSAHAMNATGQIAGSYFPVGSASDHAFLYDGSVHDLGTFGGPFSVATAINSAGRIVGGADVAASVQHAFIYDGTKHDLGTLGGTNSYARGINNSNVVVGQAEKLNSEIHAFVYDGAAMRDLNDLINPALGWILYEADDINDFGQILGTGELDPDGTGPRGREQHAFLLTPVPEPSSLCMACALVGLLSHRARRRTRG
jgi:probable HAF family extracellular repeat protein